MKNYYEILGVSITSEFVEIKRAYRKLAKQYHPDVVGEDEKKRAYMYEIQEAWQILSDAEKRADYDRRRAEEQSGRAGSGARGRAYGFDGFQGFAGAGGFGRKGAEGAGQRGADRQEAEAAFSAEDAYGAQQARFERFFGFRPGQGMDTFQPGRQGDRTPNQAAKPEDVFASFFRHIR